MRVRRFALYLAAYVLFGLLPASERVRAQNDQDWVPVTIGLGDTWRALSWRFDVDASLLQRANGYINTMQQPPVGATILAPERARWPTGVAAATEGDTLLIAAARAGMNGWRLTLANGLPSSHRPALGRTLFSPGGPEPPREWPAGISAMELSQPSPSPGQALGLRGLVHRQTFPELFLDDQPIVVSHEDQRFVALVGTGAFYVPGLHHLEGRSPDGLLWSQPIRFQPGDWTFQQITLTGEAAAINQAAIEEERERLNVIWTSYLAEPLWRQSFRLPVESFLEISSLYGARRSYNGGPYRTYHEGVDFSAYGGTAVLAPAAGRVALAERLYVRGGSIIIDHGLGIFSGYYHLSEVLVDVGQIVAPGDPIGEVGTTGLSTGNHLHWDLLVDGTWVNALSWLDQDLACWVLEGWGARCLD